MSGNRYGNYRGWRTDPNPAWWYIPERHFCMNCYMSGAFSCPHVEQPKPILRPEK